MKWKLIPEEPTDAMLSAGYDSAKDGTYFTHGSIYEAMLAAAPQPEHDRMTKEEAQALQDWKGMDGAIAQKLCDCLGCEERAWARVAELEDVIVALLPAFSNDTATAAQLRKVYAVTILKAEELTANVKLRGCALLRSPA